ncbi:DnaJ domain-containing protein [Meinhardsimonia xiamenensis]|uniref:DnaJ domain-containing protein n=1 Tax=Meinhardsimonia xiamenensis TaxID=990712 RepID=A0A1G9AEX7_9RHOB|nr:J domain-containing protein [Meinhardsimonia xiamenensis]PRX35409.1 DnaJ-like protein [Meinhardsimonia xiamenensis]SDK25932.1 DnaJ domain-containing protein [Meinhardsimonia xiamenensis]
MSLDPYAALGVSKNATDEEIRKAYRKIVKTSHPDLHPDDPEAAERFKAASVAYELLKDPEKRARYDRGEIDAMGQERPEYHYYKQYAGAQGNPYAHAGAGGAGFEGFEDISDIFAEILRGRGDRGASRWGFSTREVHARGADVRYRLQVSFLDAAKGATKKLLMPDGKSLEVKIPAGIRDGQTIRLRGKGEPGIGEGPPGDALITIEVAPHPVFKREGSDIRVVLPITIDEAVLGGKVPVPTIDGMVKLSIPKGASSGRVLRMKGRGIKPEKGGKPGDQLVELKIVMPPQIDDELEAFMKTWREKHAYDPRKGMKP